jgi:CheY-like chemotaxis protein
MISTALNGPILVMEDSDEDFDTLLETLLNIGYTRKVHRALSGDDCLAQLRGTHGPVIHPEIVLMDLNTPGTDGREVLREIKTDPVLKSTPVVVFTTSSNPRDLAACYKLGANAYHIKPVRYPEYIEILKQIFRYWLKSVALLKTRPDCHE